MEEERRLFYVAVTRGETKVTLSYATSRYKWGNLVFCEPSRFIEEIDPQFVDLPDESIARSSMPSSRTKTYKNETNNKNFKSTTAVKKLHTHLPTHVKN